MLGRSSSPNDVDTARLRLVACDAAILGAIRKGDEALAAYLDLSIPVKWKEAGEARLRELFQSMDEGKENFPWGLFLPVLKKTRTLLGNAGYIGSPQAGTVGIWFEVAQAYRGFGLATEMVRGLVDRAQDQPEVHTIYAHTPAADSEATTILRKCGFVRAEAATDPVYGWRWEWKRDTSAD